MSLPDILRDIDMKAADCVREDTASGAPLMEKVTMRPHSMPQVRMVAGGVRVVSLCVCVRLAT